MHATREVSARSQQRFDRKYEKLRRKVFDTLRRARGDEGARVRIIDPPFKTKGQLPGILNDPVSSVRSLWYETDLANEVFYYRRFNGVRQLLCARRREKEAGRTLYDYGPQTVDLSIKHLKHILRYPYGEGIFYANTRTYLDMSLATRIRVPR